jgi:hypothetical protein
MNLKYEKIFKNWSFHNIIAHPLMQLLQWVGKNDLANKVHDSTLPECVKTDESVANTDLDDPEAYRILKD